MGAIPHSGNSCSGLCGERPAPCPHTDCWQCTPSREKQVEAGLREAMTRKKIKATPLIAALELREDDEQTTITRKALEGLADRAGLDVDWNHGNPIFKERGGYRVARKFTGIGSADAKPEVKITGKQLKSSAQQIATGATEFDAEVERLTGEAQRMAEDEARKRLREQGVSDDDIRAAEKLLGPLDQITW